MRIRSVILVVVGFVCAPVHTARAQPAAPAPDGAPAPPPPEPVAPVEPQPAPYASPFGLRGMGAATAVRAESALGMDTNTSTTFVQYLTGSYAPSQHVSVFVRGGWVDFMPSAGPSSTALTNATVGALWAGNLSPDVRVAASIGSGLPVGQGGGDTPDPGAAAAIGAGNLARSRFEGSTTYSPNDLAPFAGGDIAWVSGGLTLQAEANLFQLFRVRGAQAQPDATKTSLTLGAHAGYFVLPQLSIGIELRDQTFLSTPAAVDAGKVSRSWVTVGGGPRVHLHVGDHMWLRPGLAFIQPLNDPTPAIHASSYHILQLDLPLTF